MLKLSHHANEREALVIGALREDGDGSTEAAAPGERRRRTALCPWRSTRPPTDGARLEARIKALEDLEEDYR